MNLILTQVTKNVSMEQGKKHSNVIWFPHPKTFCINCHNYKGEIDKLLKQKTEQKISINKVEEIINQMQTNTNNLYENITKLKSDTEITKSIMFSYENISQVKEMFKSTTGLEADDFQAVFEFLDTGPHCQNIKFHDGQNNKKPKSYPEDVKPGTKAKFLVFYLLKLVEKWFYYKNAFLTI